MKRYQEGGAVDPVTAHSEALQRMAEFMGVEPTGPLHGGNLAEMQMLLGQQTLDRLASMKGSTSNLDYQRAQNLVSQMGRNTDVNQRLLQMMQQTEQRSRPPMNNNVLAARVEAGEDPADLEAEQIERSYNTTGRGGRIVTHANGALEWVPNGEGDVPQAPIGDVFYDPIEELRREQEQVQGYARGGAVKKFQEGGLAAVTEEEELTTGAIEPEQIVERTTNPRAGQTLSSMILSNRQNAIDRLRQTRTNLAERRDIAREQEARDRWLAFGQAMLSPTRTGGFGESLGLAAGALREENARAAAAEAEFFAQDERMALQEIAAENQAIEFMLEQAGQSATGKDIHGAIQTMVAPEDRNKPVEQQRIIFGVYQRDPATGEWGMNPLRDQEENYFLAADKLDPVRAASLMEATTRARQEEERSQNMIETAYGSTSSLSAVRRANELFEQADPNTLDTSGVQRIKQRAAEFLGIDLGDTVDLAELQNLIAEDYIRKLAALKGSSSDRDVIEMQAISAGLGRNTTANYRQLRRMESIYERQLRRGIRQAMETGDTNAVRDLWHAVSGQPFNSNIQIYVGGMTPSEYAELAPGTSFYIVDPDNIDTYGSTYYTKPLAEPEVEE